MLKKIIYTLLIDIILISLILIIYQLFLLKDELDSMDSFLFTIITIGFGILLIIISLKQFFKIDYFLRIIKIAGTLLTLGFFVWITSKIDNYRYLYRIYICNQTKRELTGCELLYNDNATTIESIKSNETRLIKVRFKQDNSSHIILKYGLSEKMASDTFLIPSSTESGYRIEKIIK